MHSEQLGLGLQDSVTAFTLALSGAKTGEPGAVGAGVATIAPETAAGPDPAELWATTLNVYVVPKVSPYTVHEVVVVVHVRPPGLEVTA
jgi:hypothetical protein